jgi:hypothetical protein
MSANTPFSFGDRPYGSFCEQTSADTEGADDQGCSIRTPSYRGDPVLGYFRQRLVQIYGPDLYTAFLVGARARGVMSHNSAYDIVLFLNQTKEKLTESGNVESIQTEMLESFDAEVNVFPFPSTDYSSKSGVMRAVRKVGVPLVPTPKIQNTFDERAERLFNGEDPICLKVLREHSHGDLAVYAVHALNIKSGEYRNWSILLPSQGDEPDQDVGNYAPIDCWQGENRDNALDDPILIGVVKELMAFTKDHKIVSTKHAQADQTMLAIARSYRLSAGLVHHTWVEDYHALVLSLAKATANTAPEIALCRAEQTAHERYPDDDPTARLRCEAEVLRLLSGISTERKE